MKRRNIFVGKRKQLLCAYGLSGCSVRVLGLPLWWVLSTPGVFAIAVVGVIFLVRKVFVDFDLDEESEGGAHHAE